MAYYAYDSYHKTEESDITDTDIDGDISGNENNINNIVNSSDNINNNTKLNKDKNLLLVEYHNNKKYKYNLEPDETLLTSDNLCFLDKIKSISIFQKIEILFMERKKRIFPASNTNNQQQTMDTYYATPLNAKGTCFRIVIVEDPKTPKHIKTKKN